jgi:hypothetical protein
MFEQLSGLKINFYKSELFYFNEDQDDGNLYAELFSYGLDNFLISYLCILIRHRSHCHKGVIFGDIHRRPDQVYRFGG